MKKIILLLSFLFSPSLHAENKNIFLTGSIQFFEQGSQDQLSLPHSLGPRQDIGSSFVINPEDGISLKKVYATEFKFSAPPSGSNILKAKIEVFYFNRPEGQYLSQQVFIRRNEILISKCTSYFALEQTYFVPGACSGRDGDHLYGIAIYK